MFEATGVSAPVMTLIGVALGGGIGAVLRAEIGRLIDRTTKFTGPAGIFVVNVLASAAIGLLLGVGLIGVVTDPTLSRLGTVLASGVIGGFSTLSTVATDTAKLIENRRYGWVFTNTVGMLAMSAAACWVGVALGHALTG